MLLRPLQAPSWPWRMWVGSPKKKRAPSHEEPQKSERALPKVHHFPSFPWGARNPPILSL